MPEINVWRSTGGLRHEEINRMQEVLARYEKALLAAELRRSRWMSDATSCASEVADSVARLNPPCGQEARRA
jgi:hypothetical protein